MPAIELTLDPADAPRLARLPGMRSAGRSTPISLEWHDSNDGVLAARALAVARRGRRWRLEQLRPATALEPPPILAEAATPAALGPDIPDPLDRIAGVVGTARTLLWNGEAGEASLFLLHATVGGHGHPPLCRVTITAEPGVIETLTPLLAATLAISVPRAALAAQVIATATGQPPAPRALGAPLVPPGQSVGDSLATILAHLADVMLHWADRIPAANDPEPVHQMRVATRRLRSALSVFRAATPCPQLAALGEPMKACAARLGTARDWDVFLAGTGAALAATFPDDKRCAAMLRAAARARRAAYADLRQFLAGPEFRALSIALACAATLRPWEAAADASLAQQDTKEFAATILAKRLKRVRRAGRGIAGLPTVALHELRKDCKRLRYTAEFFASLFPGKATTRFLKRLAALQEELGLLNDSAAVSGLVGQLGRAERGYAAGLVEGFSAAHAAPARTRILACWRKFKAADPFWVQ